MALIATNPASQRSGKPAKDSVLSHGQYGMVEHNGLHLAPISLKDANAFVARYHRHHKPVVGHKFSIACVDGEGKLRGVRRIFTYILETENGASLRAAGWDCDGPAGGRNWTGERYRQEEMFPLMKVRYSKHLAGGKA